MERLVQSFTVSDFHQDIEPEVSRDPQVISNWRLSRQAAISRMASALPPGASKIWFRRR